MHIIIAKHYGLCFGVRDAIAQADRLAAAGPLTILGELVHNPLVQERLAARGVREAPLAAPGSAATAQVMITAHGASDRDRERWRSAGFGVADGTCPLVRQAHQQLGSLVAAGYHPVIIGQKKHVEVLGLLGDFPQGTVVESAEDVSGLPERGSLGIISQTTQPIEKVRALVAAIQAARPQCQVRFIDTVCPPTKNRQLALQELTAAAETIVVVGGRHSNNTRQLVAAAEAAGCKAYHVESATDLRREWFIGVERVGITAGTSTLKETVAAVAERLRSFAPAEAPLRTRSAFSLESAT
jgi:4-hydroxy-3-methylbut-2-en-1-yl diphosphate reductase